MMSMQRKLTVTLWVAVSAVGAVAASIAYFVVSDEARELLDVQLQEVASVVATQTSATTVAAMPGRHKDIEMAIWGPDGTREYASTDLLATPIDRPGFVEVTLGKERYRVFSLWLHGRRIEVAQTVDIREDQAEAAALAGFLSVCVLLPLLSAVIAFVIRAQLKPVQQVAEAVSRRDALETGALQTHGLPQEIAPLVEEINRLLERQSDAVRRERGFIADAAHALRTPLAALQLQVDVLDGSSDPQERAARLADLKSGISRAARLSRQLLSLARIDAAVETSSSAMDLNETLAELGRIYAPIAASAHVQLDIHELRLPATVHCDLSAFMSICGNLLDNAIRYTPAGGRIDLQARHERSFWLLEIQDEGHGLPSDELDRVFERFYCVPGDPNAGTGLGLATVKGLVAQLGGRVELRNRADRLGLVAVVALPAAGAEALQLRTYG